MRVNPLNFRIFQHTIRPIFSVCCVYVCYVCISKHALLISNNGRIAVEKRDSCFFHYKYICVYLKCCDMFFSSMPSLSLYRCYYFDFIFVWVFILYWNTSYFNHHSGFFRLSFGPVFCCCCWSTLFTVLTHKAYGIRMFTK